MGNTMTIIGSLGRDVELRFSHSGKAVGNFTVADTPRKFNKQSNEWEDGETVWMDCTVFGQQAENAAASLVKGTRVVVSGRVEQQNWEDKNTGAKRSKLVLLVDEVGPSLKYATAKVTKAARSEGGGGFGGGQKASQAPQDDPWGSAPQGGGFGAQAAGEAPF